MHACMRRFSHFTARAGRFEEVAAAAKTLSATICAENEVVSSSCECVRSVVCVCEVVGWALRKMRLCCPRATARARCCYVCTERIADKCCARHTCARRAHRRPYETAWSHWVTSAPTAPVVHSHASAVGTTHPHAPTRAPLAEAAAARRSAAPEARALERPAQPATVRSLVHAGSAAALSPPRWVSTSSGRRLSHSARTARVPLKDPGT